MAIVLASILPSRVDLTDLPFISPLTMDFFNQCSLTLTVVQEQERAENELVPLGASGLSQGI